MTTPHGRAARFAYHAATVAAFFDAKAKRWPAEGLNHKNVVRWRHGGLASKPSVDRALDDVGMTARQLKDWARRQKLPLVHHNRIKS